MKKFLLLLLVCGPALADDAGVLKCRTLSVPSLRLACYDAMAVSPVPVQAAQALPPPAVSRQDMEKSFGLPVKRAPIDSISSTIPGKFEGWGPNQQIKLANGQVWRVADDSSGVVYGTNLKVTLEAGSFGTTFLIIEGTNRSPKVKRLQ